MTSTISEPTARTSVYSIMLILGAFPIASFTCALFTDIAYVWTANVIWVDFSTWLLAAGMAGGLVAAIAGLVWLVARRRDPYRKPVWSAVIISLLVLGIAFFNNLVHSRDAWTSVMPLGLAASVVTVLLMVIVVGLGVRGRGRRDLAI